MVMHMQYGLKNLQPWGATKCKCGGWDCEDYMLSHAFTTAREIIRDRVSLVTRSPLKDLTSFLCHNNNILLANRYHFICNERWTITYYHSDSCCHHQDLYWRWFQALACFNISASHFARSASCFTRWVVTRSLANSDFHGNRLAVRNNQHVLWYLMSVC